MNPSFVLLPILAALAQGQEPFNGIVTRDKAFILEHYGLQDKATRQARAASLLAAAEKSLERQVHITDSVASTNEANRQMAQGATIEDLNEDFPWGDFEKRVVRAPLQNAYKEISDTTTIVPAYDTKKYEIKPFTTKPFVKNLLFPNQHLYAYKKSLKNVTKDYPYLILQGAPAICLITNKAGKKYCRLPLSNRAGALHFAQCDSKVTSAKDLLETIQNFKTSQQKAGKRKVHIAIPRIDAKQRNYNDAVRFELTDNAQQELCKGNMFLDGVYQGISHEMDFIIPCTEKSLCWIEDTRGLVTFATVCDPSTYSKMESKYEKFNGSLADFPN